eukprot:gene811-1127_t
MTGLNGRGEMLWQRYTAIQWEAGGDKATAPTLVPLALRPHSVPTAILAVGQSTGVVMSEHGNELAEFHVAFPPAAPAVVADFDGVVPGFSPVGFVGGPSAAARARKLRSTEYVD